MRYKLIGITEQVINLYLHIRQQSVFTKFALESSKHTMRSEWHNISPIPYTSCHPLKWINLRHHFINKHIKYII